MPRPDSSMGFKWVDFNTALMTTLSTAGNCARVGEWAESKQYVIRLWMILFMRRTTVTAKRRLPGACCGVCVWGVGSVTRSITIPFVAGAGSSSTPQYKLHAQVCASIAASMCAWRFSAEASCSNSKSISLTSSAAVQARSAAALLAWRSSHAAW